jgi:adenine-specific DNA-methyltransferase
LKLNFEDNENRKFIIVQLPEPTDEKSEAFKSGYKTIIEIGKERIRKAGEKIKSIYLNSSKINSRKTGTGFKVFKLDSLNKI